MKKTLFFICALCSAMSSMAQADSVWLFTYAQKGLRMAWSEDRTNWNPVGNNYTVLASDYGTWSTEKNAYDPYMVYADGVWSIVWSVNDRANQFAYTRTADFIHWLPQDYPYVKEDENCLKPIVEYADGLYTITYYTSKGNTYAVTTEDFHHFSAPTKVSRPASDGRNTILLDGKELYGQTVRIHRSMLDNLLNDMEQTAKNTLLEKETLTEDDTTYGSLKTVKASLSIDMNESKKISDNLMGIFFEDINYAADGGIYAELIQNRDFEYAPLDNPREKDWGSSYAWSVTDGARFSISTENPISRPNHHHAVLEVTDKGSLANGGFDGIALRKGERYDFSMFGKVLNGNGNEIEISIKENGKTIASGRVKAGINEWLKSECVLIATEDTEAASLHVRPLTVGRYAFDMVSLFPQKTYKNRKNGLRADLMEALAAMKPRFVRFPGGCLVHGDGLDNMYRWKYTIGNLEDRIPMRNIWNYHQSLGLGYYEYFLMCEDLGAEPLPVVAAGVPCQNSSHGGAGQQGGLPMDEMDDYIQDIFDLIEWANGNPATSEWARKRAEAGHPEPFNLKYIGIGNEDLISWTFEERYRIICEAVRQKYPDINIVGTAGPFWHGSDYERGWEISRDLQLDLVDEHYYVTPGWFINHQDFYDNYDRKGPKVYLGEYAAHANYGRANNMETALTVALYLTNVERNADIVEMASYAPLLCNELHKNWTPDLIYFNNKEVKLTTDYYTQMLFGQNAGTRYVASELEVAGEQQVSKRVSVSTVVDKSGDLIIKLVNTLPADVNTSVRLNNTSLKGKTEAQMTLFGGQPLDTDCVPVTSTIEVGRKFSYTLPAYSLTVIRIPTK